MNVQRFCCDDETGEVVTYHVNEETGEPSVENPAPMHMRLPQPIEMTEEPKYMQFPRGYMSKTRKFQSLKANIIAGSNTLSHRLLLIPTLMIFPDFISLVLMVLEVFLHVRCHKKNKNLTDPNLYYRSPFHIVTSMFCAVCRESEASSKIGMIQDKRRLRYDYLRGIAI